MPQSRVKDKISSFIPLMGELSDLKRIISADREGSTATRLFLDGWHQLYMGISIEKTMHAICARALAACRLGDLDNAKLVSLGLDHETATAILRRAFDAVSEPLNNDLEISLRITLGDKAQSGMVVPDFCNKLAHQPRAGITCPGRARIMLQPAENHADHSLIVAVIGALVAPLYDAEPAFVFLAGMSHHLHSAAMPDSGFTGEMLLGNALDTVITSAREQALSALPAMLANQIRPLLNELGSDKTSTARAFHAADVLDRVLEIKQHLKTSNLTMTTILGDYELVHAGPIKAFHDTVLAQAGLHA